MSLLSGRTYLRGRMDALGFKEFDENGLDFDRISSNRIDKSYHLEPGSFDLSNLNHGDIETSNTTTIRVHFKGKRKADVDFVISEGQRIIESIMSNSTRTTQPGGHFNVKGVSMDLETIDTAENIMRLILVFTTEVSIEI